MASCLGIGGLSLRGSFWSHQPSSPVLPPPRSLVIATPTTLHMSKCPCTCPTTMPCTCLNITSLLCLYIIFHSIDFPRMPSLIMNTCFLFPPRPPKFSINIALSKKVSWPLLSQEEFISLACVPLLWFSVTSFIALTLITLLSYPLF